MKMTPFGKTISTKTAKSPTAGFLKEDGFGDTCKSGTLW